MENDELQFQLRYTGARFDRHRLPVDMLSDLPAFRDLVVAYVKQRWHQTHADRVRVPKGFDRSLSFDLQRIDPGSAMPALVWDHGEAQRQLPTVSGELPHLVSEAYEDVLRLFDEAANEEFPRALSSEFIRPLNKFGAALREDERIEFWGSQGVNGNVIYIDNQLRKNLITRVRETYESRFEGSGILVGIDAPVDSDTATLRVKTNEYGTISILVERDRIKSEFDGHIDNAVQFDLTIELNSEDHFSSVVAAHDIALIELPEGWESVLARLDEISTLRERWLDGTGTGISSEAIAAAAACILSRPVLGPLVKLFPTEAGGVLLEFEFGGWDMSIEFLSNGRAEIYGIEINGSGSLDPISTTALDNQFFSVLDLHLDKENE